MAIILLIETATEVCSVALANEHGIIGERTNVDGKSHAALLTVYIEELLRINGMHASQLGAVAVSEGPGSYTGLRIGVSAAKGICYGANIPLIAVPTLQAMACGFVNQNQEILKDAGTWLCPMIDARRLEVYTAMYSTSAEKLTEINASIIDESSFADILNVRKVIFFGNGSDKCQAVITHPNALFVNGYLPSAKDMHTLAMDALVQKKFKDVAYFEPYYLKDFIATVAKNKVLGN